MHSSSTQWVLRPPFYCQLLWHELFLDLTLTTKNKNLILSSNWTKNLWFHVLGWYSRLLESGTEKGHRNVCLFFFKCWLPPPTQLSTQNESHVVVNSISHLWLSKTSQRLPYNRTVKGKVSQLSSWKKKWNHPKKKKHFGN